MHECGIFAQKWPHSVLIAFDSPIGSDCGENCVVLWLLASRFKLVFDLLPPHKVQKKQERQLRNKIYFKRKMHEIICSGKKQIYFVVFFSQGDVSFARRICAVIQQQRIIRMLWHFAFIVTTIT